MKPLYLVAASALALTAAACGPKVPAARAALDCPAKEGELTRTGTASDGKSCTYVSSDGGEVTLQLVSLAGNADATLASIEKTLLATPPAPEAPAAKLEPASAATSAAAEKAVREAREDTKVSVNVKVDRDHETTVVTDKGAGVVTERGGTTRVTMPGIHIVANEDEETADVKIGPLQVNASDAGVNMRIRRDVRLRGEALNPEKRGLRATFIYTGESLPSGYRFLGYEAGGPKRGPITVALVRGRSEGDDFSDISSDVTKLVRKNGGV